MISMGIKVTHSTKLERNLETIPKFNVLQHSLYNLTTSS